MNLKQLFASAAAIAAVAASAAPIVPQDSVLMNQAEDSRLVTITYTLSDGPAIVTLDVQTNRTGAATADEADWASIGAEHFNNAEGAVNRLVSPASATERQTILWQPLESWAGECNEATRAVVTVWSTNSPPPYMVVDLRRDEARPDAAEPRVRYYISTNALPHGGLTNDVYRNAYMAMRLIPAQGRTFKMGSPSTEYAHGNSGSAEAFHFVTFTNADFYMGVFPITRGQARNFCSEGKNDNAGIIDMRLPNGTWIYQYINCIGESNNVPANIYSHGIMRGSGAGYTWPDDWHAVAADSLCGLMRGRTGAEFDLPTDAQWEFACRAGTTSTYYNTTNTVTAANIQSIAGEIAWCDFNTKIDGKYYLPRTGLKEPNAWGLYDMCGSLYELCLDYYESDLGEAHVFEPVGPATGDKRVTRGGCYTYAPGYARSSCRHRTGDSSMTMNTGVRLVCPANLKWPAK